MRNLTLEKFKVVNLSKSRGEQPEHAIQGRFHLKQWHIAVTAYGLACPHQLRPGPRAGDGAIFLHVIDREDVDFAVVDASFEKNRIRLDGVNHQSGAFSGGLHPDYAFTESDWSALQDALNKAFKPNVKCECFNYKRVPAREQDLS